ncbi:MAG: hypothetical protein C5B52_13895 [Bacteroidetes bacterium]|nr:MAG: hypothetical protein C5B52_13895 [Bacteroidota bacterium]
MRFRLFIAACLLSPSLLTSAQKGKIYESLPVGKYAVGYKIITLTDESRISKPEFNYLGEKNQGDRSEKITIHVWYPCISGSGTRNVLFSDYCYQENLKSSTEPLDTVQKYSLISGKRRSIENWFGKTQDADWIDLLQTKMLAQLNADAARKKFPLLVGMLRPLSTTIVNEVLASQGYVVAMINHENINGFADAALVEIPNLQFAIEWLQKHENVSNQLGTFGFSGSGFTQVLFAMYDLRVQALADIESGIYMEGLYQGISASNFYKPSKLKIPFLHIFSHDLSRQEKYLDDFETKCKFSNRYRLILNQPKLHHWDFATEGYVSSLFLKNRGEAASNIEKSFEIATNYLLNFFDAQLKGQIEGQKFLAEKFKSEKYPSSLWEISNYAAKIPAPTREEFELIVSRLGIDSATHLTLSRLKDDSSTDVMVWFQLNRLGYQYLDRTRYKEAIGVFKLNIILHPDDPNLYDSLCEGYERSGDNENARKYAAITKEMLDKKSNLTDAEKGLMGNAEKRLRN